MGINIPTMHLRGASEVSPLETVAEIPLQQNKNELEEIDVRSVIREKKIYCGNQFMEVDIYSHTLLPMPRKRSKKRKVSAPKQNNLNEKNAQRYFIQLLNTNFTEGDLHITLTYNNKHYPSTIEEAEKEAANFIRRLAYKRKRAGLEELKYVLISEYGIAADGVTPIRLHHHIVTNGGLDRTEVENIWRKPKKKGQKQGEWIGYANTDALQINDSGLTGLAKYLTKKKNPKGKKRYSSSRNLKKPEYQTNDRKYTRRQVEKIAKEEVDNLSYWRKHYPNWDVTECKAEYNDLTGWSIYLKLRRARE